MLYHVADFCSLLCHVRQSLVKYLHLTDTPLGDLRHVRSALIGCPESPPSLPPPPSLTMLVIHTAIITANYRSVLCCIALCSHASYTYGIVSLWQW